MLATYFETEVAPILRTAKPGTPTGSLSDESVGECGARSQHRGQDLNRHLAAETGPNQIVMGTDYPFPWTQMSVDHIVDTPGLSDADKVAMLGGTARALLGITA